jgi:hypothetical protein
MGREARPFGGLGAAAAICLALLLAAPAARAAAPTLYVGAAPGYKVALAVAGQERSVLELAGTVPCHFNEPREPGGTESFSVYPSPRPMRRDPQAGGWFRGQPGFPHANVAAVFHHDRAIGTYGYESSEESFHCEVHKAPFEALRYEPIGSPTAVRPKRGEKRVYYDGEGPTHLFLRTSGELIEGVRGVLRTRCPVGAESVPGRQLPLFRAPIYTAHDPDGGFSFQAGVRGILPSHARLHESILLSGRAGHDRTVGAYRRVRTVTRGKRQVERCVTDLPFDATRYLPAKP